MARLLHFVLNTECNAWDLKPMQDSPGVCRFCYRAKERIVTTPKKIEELLRIVRQQSDIVRVVFTGGDPLMPRDSHVEFAVQAAKKLGFEVNLHTNGLLLSEKFSSISRWVDIFTLAIDGADPDTADWERGIGYFDRFLGNLQLLMREGKTLAFNSFVSPHNFPHLGEVGKMIAGIAEQSRVEYWLISQYRPIARDTAKKREIYTFSSEQFRFAIERLVTRFPRLNVYSQPLREDGVYPMRMWLLADGLLTMDTGEPTLGRNVIVGSCFERGFAELYKKTLEMSWPA
jgi:MoaA/NifB/PqqE/SkfB family radical SAM enzyme